jgi:hypothetical protein
MVPPSRFAPAPKGRPRVDRQSRFHRGGLIMVLLRLTNCIKKG